MKENANKTIHITDITAAPDAPQNLAAYAAGPTQIITTWDTVTGADRYNVYRSTAASGPYVLAGLTASPYYTDVGLTPNTTYYYHVTAVESETESSLSNMASATTNADIPVPDNVTAIPVSQTQIAITWNAVLNATAYAVYRSTTPDGTYQYIGTTEDPLYNDTGLTPNTTYYYRVAALISGTEGSPSAYAAATTFPDIPFFPAPANVQARALTCTEIFLSWEAVPNAEGYHVYRSETASGPYQLVDITAATVCHDAGLSPDTTCYYFLQAYLGSQFSPQSVPVSAMTPSCKTPVPPSCCPCCPNCGCDPCCCKKCGCKKCGCDMPVSDRICKC